MMPAATLVADAEHLRRLAELIGELGGDDFIALDSEFRRTSTLMPLACLLQLRVRGGNYLVDPLQHSLDLTALLQALIATPAAVLLFSGEEDLDVLAGLAARCCGQRRLPGRLYDLQLMALFCGDHGRTGLHSMVKALLGVELDKSQTLSDWTARPLSEQQLSYAVSDILYLEDLHAALSRRISAENRGFFEDECRVQAEEALSEPVPDELYLEISGAGALTTHELVRLRHLCSRRYGFAVEHDVALNWVITGSCLCQLARTPPGGLRELAHCGMKGGAIRSYGRMVVAWCREAAALPDEPGIRLAHDLFAQKREYQGRMQAVRSRLARAASSRGIDPALVASKKLVANLFYAKYYGEQPLLLQRWQARICPDALDLVVLD